MGKITATFRRYTDDRDTAETYLRDHSGERVTVLGELDPSEYDREETGVMHCIAFPDGTEAEAFNDELIEWRLGGMKTPEDVVHDLFTTYAHIERMSDEKITAESLHFLAARAIEVDRAERPGNNVLTVPNAGLRVGAPTPIDVYTQVGELLDTGYLPDEIEWEAVR